MNDELRCHFCGSTDIRLAEIGIALGMGGDDYSFCQRCLESMTRRSSGRRSSRVSVRSTRPRFSSAPDEYSRADDG